ncbi:D/L-lactic acid transporter LarD [Sporolactobacillus terrae]|uniref:Aquaporin family protein n=1 Tax=Sporolactobacillus terrae TaxID=269673 RepID=A0A410D7F3_9BACL|nr:D/L-lactic acid transporter LarD [Sporolactobacillus terrae]QAA22042.1 aquaporin family protein [Sporolactobacillus terrae]QAA25015.1 aquaporin family protein [Sporolactobacillus terrae]UAK16838.1 aquaporin family protein [Sporolactobacillus terrae]BBN98333.1 glycerol uptake facilitator protein [Sporolactobacillus terrae]
MHQLIAEFLGTALMIIFGVGVHCCEVLNTSKYQNSGHIFAITTWGFGITISLFIFGAVNINPAMVVAQAILGNIPWTSVIPISIAEVLGGVFGSIVVFIAYYDQFKASIDIDRVKIRNIFSTNPNVRNLPRNFFVEFIDTFIFITAILAIAAATTEAPAILPIGVGLLVWAIGMGMGGPTGFAMNLARDMGPRIAHAILPIPGGKADNDWQYGIIVPGIAPFFGAACAALFSRYFLGL